MKQDATKLDKVRELLREYPSSYPSNTLAGLVMQGLPGLYATQEHARSAVRYLRGLNGARDRAKLSRAEGRRVPDPTPVWPMPDPVTDDSKQWRPVRLNPTRALVISDLQIPYHAPAVVTKVLRYAKDRRADHVILLGDVIDFYAISDFERDPSLRSVNEEVQTTRSFFEHLRDTLPKAHVYMLPGNHEERLPRFVWRHVPELATLMGRNGDLALSLESVLDTRSYGIQVTPERTPILLGEHLHLFHGHEFKLMMTQPRNPAQWLFQRTLANSMCGDKHKTDSSVNNGADRSFSTYVLGCLCGLHPRFCRVNQWNHGFAIVEFDRRGVWSVENRKVINGAIV